MARLGAVSVNHRAVTKGFDLSSLIFNVPQADGTAPRLNFTEFATGADVAGRRKYALSARPELMLDLLKPLKAYLRSISPRTFHNTKTALVMLWRFLDAHPHLSVSSVGELTDLHGSALYLWYPNSGGRPGTHRQLVNIVNQARRHKQLAELSWPRVEREDEVDSRDIEPLAIKAVYRALIAEGQQIKAMFAEGELLASRGRDPRSVNGRPGTADWDKRENHAWLIHHIALPVMVDGDEFKRQHAFYPLSRARGHDQPGPSHLSPGLNQPADSIEGKLRWFYPSLFDTIVFLLLFLLASGWNLSTALNLDISKADWATTHRLNRRLKVLKAFKPRSAAYQYAISLEQSQWRPYQIVQFMLERTAGLRRKLVHDIEKLQLLVSSDSALQPQLSDLINRSKSPWLYYSRDRIGEVAAIESGRSSQYINRCLRALIGRHDIRDSRGELCRFTASDWRDAFASNTNDAGGILFARAGLGHVANRDVGRYLNQPRLRRRADAQVINLMSHAFAELRAGLTLDGPTLRVLVQQGSITEEQRLRISDFKNRTRLGVGCLDPKAPPQDISPDHKEGELCRHHRCTMGCPNLVLFDDSLDDLTREYAQLVKIQEMTPALSWDESDRPFQKESLEAVLERYPADDVKLYVDRHLRYFEDHPNQVLDLEESYSIE